MTPRPSPPPSPLLLMAVGVLASAMLFGCAAGAPTQAPTSGIFRARVIYLIHGDGDYVYHDSAGVRRRADEDVLQQAKRTGIRSKDTEVLIFHQKSEFVTSLFGAAEGRFYHYRYGALQSQKTYFRGKGDFDDESKLVRRYAAPSALVAAGVSREDAEKARRIPTVLAYFGHEIPQVLARSDDTSSLVVTRFTAGLKNLASPFSPEETLENDSLKPLPPGPRKTSKGPVKPYGLIILSSCYGGTPRMMSALAPLTDYAVASPAYLHLSHLDTRGLKDATRGDSLTDKSPWKMLADTVAAQSFARLQQKTLTEITVAVYDLEAARPFAQAFSKTRANAYAKADIRTKKSFIRPSFLRNDSGSTAANQIAWRDCASDPMFNDAQAAQGVSLFYRAPQFGAGKNIASRSGWQCPF